MARSLVIVESPAKARTLHKFLGRGYEVKASMGHVRDLPKRSLGVNEKTFEPTYTTLPEKKKVLAELKKASRRADAIYLAADPDREGEAICWHLEQELSKETRAAFRRVLLHEITKKAVLAAFENPGTIDPRKVEAQQARRILDRLVGYKISPLLWEKVRRGLSAGRVQSVALRIIVERERAIRSFVPREYWTLAAQLAAKDPPPFLARLVARGGQKLELRSKEEAARVIEALGFRVVGEKPVEGGPAGSLLLEAEPVSPVPFRVVRIQSQQKTKNPPAPFITAKLQQEAARQLGFSVSKTMRLAQGLYEGRDLGPLGSVGLITYMRTDSTRVSEEALEAVRRYIAETYGASALPAEPRRYKSGKQAQEAHEAIRPTSLEFTPQAVQPYLGRDELRLYTLIWNRFVASQMESAVFDTTRVDIEAGEFTFRASGSVLRSAGWLAVYREAQEEEERAEADLEETEEEDRPLPLLAEGESLEARALVPRQKFTQPPSRFSEATLVRELEENGIGRPSTYATILATIQDRDYVVKEKGRFRPTELGELVNDLMVASFGDIVDVGYTARMEEELDEIEEGRLRWTEALREFQEKFERDLEAARREMPDVKRQAKPTREICEKCGRPMVLKWGRFGEFLACSGYPDCKNTREAGPLEGGKEKEAGAAAEAAAKSSGAGTAAVTSSGAGAEPCEKCGKPMVLKRGRYGPFLACSGYPACRTTRKVAVNSEGKAEAKPDVLLEETCPRCGSRLARKHGRFGEFVACSNYPKCRYVKMKETGVSCPECGRGKIVERRSKRGKIFFGCDRYPDCGFVVWSRPVPKPCPRCGRPYLVEKSSRRDGRRLVCEAESCGYEEPVAAEAPVGVP
jgi:DNA topoisomerase-1